MHKPVYLNSGSVTGALPGKTPIWRQLRPNGPFWICVDIVDFFHMPYKISHLWKELQPSSAKSKKWLASQRDVFSTSFWKFGTSGCCLLLLLRFFATHQFVSLVTVQDCINIICTFNASLWIHTQVVKPDNKFSQLYSCTAKKSSCRSWGRYCHNGNVTELTIHFNNLSAWDG